MAQSRSALQRALLDLSQGMQSLFGLGASERRLVDELLSGAEPERRPAGPRRGSAPPPPRPRSARRRNRHLALVR